MRMNTRPGSKRQEHEKENDHPISKQLRLNFNQIKLSYDISFSFIYNRITMFFIIGELYATNLLQYICVQGGYGLSILVRNHIIK